MPITYSRPIMKSENWGERMNAIVSLIGINYKPISLNILSY